jgi:hypothetical protein
VPPQAGLAGKAGSMAVDLNDPHVVELVRRLCDLYLGSTHQGSHRVLTSYEDPIVEGICGQKKLFEVFGYLVRRRLLAVVDRRQLAGTFEVRPEIVPAAATVESPRQPVVTSKRVTLFQPDEAPLVYGRKKSLLTLPQYKVIKALIEAGTDGLTERQLFDKSGHTDVRGIMKRVAEKDRDWKKVICFANQPGRRYRIR